jgi:Cytochrome P450
MLAFDDEGMKLISKNAESEDSFFGEMHRIQKSVLGPETASLEKLNSENRRLLMGYLNELRGQETVDLYAWLRHLFTKANTTACFGQLNPFEKYPDLEQVFWDWEGNVKILLLGLPKFLAPGQYSVAVKSRQTLVDAFLEYADKGGPDSPSTSAFVRELYNLGIKRSLSHENSGRAMIGSVLAILANTIPTSFWLLAYIFSEPTLLAAVRGEIEPIMCSSNSGNEGRRKLLGFDLTQARDRCPLFVSCYEEVLRLSAGIVQMRHTVQETLLNNGRYLLTKECSIHMPTPFIHNDPASWGANAADFKADRFLKSKVTREQSAAFRPFGGGNALCPGRFFAFNEIVTFVGTMVLGFDVMPMGGTWKLPGMDRSKMPLSSLKPVVDIEVAVSRRVGYEDIDFQ